MGKLTINGNFQYVSLPEGIGYFPATIDYRTVHPPAAQPLPWRRCNGVQFHSAVASVDHGTSWGYPGDIPYYQNEITVLIVEI
jgi:hypothetical protein